MKTFPGQGSRQKKLKTKQDLVCKDFLDRQINDLRSENACLLSIWISHILSEFKYKVPIREGQSVTDWVITAFLFLDDERCHGRKDFLNGEIELPVRWRGKHVR